MPYGLTENGYKIFLDRYALKDGKRETLTEGSTVIVCTDTKTGQREIGTVLRLNNGHAWVMLDDKTELPLSISQIDLPLELDPAQMFARVAKGLASVEEPEVQAEWTEKFDWLLKDWKFVPGGRILTSAGTDQKLTLFNCFVIPSPHDSRQGIMTTLTQMTEIMSRGGGVGINVSSLRPRYGYVKSVNGRSSGAVSWAALYSYVTGLVEQAGSRRGALMLILSDWHPDLMEFINSKREAGKIVNANISVAISDRFMRAVKDDSDWDFLFPPTDHPDYDRDWDGNLVAWITKHGLETLIKHGSMKARDIWQAIIESAWASAEPGIFFIDRYNKMSNSWYYAPIISCNPCAEQGLPAWAVCNLGALNLSYFVEGQAVLWDVLGQAIQFAVRFLDNIVELSLYPFPEQSIQQRNERRVGLGTMGLAEMLIKLKIKYGSDESLAFINKLYQFIACTAYNASCDLAKEKVWFSNFDKDKFLESGFIKSMPQYIQDKIKANGIRNVTLLTQAPTGTTGTMVGVSTGIEPHYLWEYARNSRLGRHIETVELVERWRKANTLKPLPDYFVTAMDLAPEDHVRVQAAVQRWTDSSIAKTCNLPADYTVKQVGQIYELMYELGCKGGTIYRDKSRDVQVLETVSKPQAVVVQTEVKPRSGVLHGETYRQQTPVGTAYVTINQTNGVDEPQPFEIFVNVSKVGSDVAADADAIGRLMSLILRLPSTLSPYERLALIAGQLSGIGGRQSVGFGPERVASLSDGVGRVIQQYLGSEEMPGLPEIMTLIGELCPECGNATLIPVEGCMKCDCGYSLC